VNPVIYAIEAVRKKKGVTKTHIAKHCDRSVSWYTDITKGRRRMFLDDLLLVAEALGESPIYFFKYELSETRNNQTA